jgi:hypothetical protein
VKLLYFSGGYNFLRWFNSAISRSPYFVVCRFKFANEYLRFFSIVVKFNHINAPSKLNFSNLFSLALDFLMFADILGIFACFLLELIFFLHIRELWHGHIHSLKNIVLRQC